jgi:predicted metal-binding protein
MKEQIEHALNSRCWEPSVVPTSALIFSAEVRKACEVNTCGNHNKCWTCPPAVGTLEDLKQKILAYQQALVFTTKFDLEDSFDYEGMMKAAEFHNRLTRDIFETFGKVNPVYGAGGCTISKKSAYPDPCRFPDKTYSSIEASGINVTELSQAAQVKYNNGTNTVTYFSMVLFNE